MHHLVLLLCVILFITSTLQPQPIISIKVNTRYIGVDFIVCCFTLLHQNIRLNEITVLVFETDDFQLQISLIMIVAPQVYSTHISYLTMLCFLSWKVSIRC